MKKDREEKFKTLTVQDQEEIERKRKEFHLLYDRLLNLGNASTVGFRKGETYYNPVA